MFYLYLRCGSGIGEVFPGGSIAKESACNSGDLGSSLGSGRSLEEENGNPFQYSCLGNPMDREAWQATIYGVAKRVRHNLATKQQQEMERCLKGCWRLNRGRCLGGKRHPQVVWG